MAIKQTAGRDQLGDFAPDFAHFNISQQEFPHPLRWWDELQKIDTQ